MKKGTTHASVCEMKNVRDKRFDKFMPHDSYCDNDDCGEHCGTNQD